MSTIGEWGRRVRFLLNRARVERDLEQEMAAHRAMMEDGRSFGSTLKLREESRDIWGWNWLDHFVQDARHGLRVLFRAPAFTLSALLILSLGIGLNLALFQLVNIVFLQPLAVKDPHTLVRFSRRSPSLDSGGVPYPATQFLRRNNTVLSAVITQTSHDLAWGEDASDRIRASYVSANFFEQLGYGAARGRVFAEGIDERAGAAPVAVLSHNLWQSRFQGAEDIAGRTIRLNNRPVVVIGVAPVSFPGTRLETPELWLPIDQIDYFNPGTGFKNAWESNNTEMFGRLRAEISPPAAREAMRVAMSTLALERPGEFQNGEWLDVHSAAVRFRRPRDEREFWRVTLLAGGLTLLVLMVACSNLSNLVLARSNQRLREFSVRAALGAGRVRVLKQVMTESLMLALGGLAGGLVVGHGAVKALATNTLLPFYVDLSPDWRTLAAGTALSLLTLLFFALAPAVRIARQDLSGTMKDGGLQGSGSLRRSRLQRTLVAAQLAGSCVLLIVAGFMVRGLQRLLTADPGFEFEKVVVLDAALGRYGIKGEAARAYWESVRRTIAAHPDCEQVALTSLAPLGSIINESMYRDAQGLRVTRLEVENEFFPLMQIPLIAGRKFLPGDDHRTTVIISRRLAERMYGTLDVLGKGFPKHKPAMSIVGVAGNAGLIKIQSSSVAEQYSPIDRAGYEGLLLVARARTNPERLLEPMRSTARRADDRVLAATTLLRTEFEKKLRGPRLTSLVASLAGLLALTLACFGIFGLIAYCVASRTKEIGIRVALGAGRASIVTMLLGQLAGPAAAGIALGGAAGTLAARLLQGDPLYLNANDATAPAGAVAVLVIAGGIAAMLPARRALRILPTDALRHQ